MVVLGVGLEVFGQVLDALAQESDLDLGRSGIAGMDLVRVDDGVLSFARQGQTGFTSSRHKRRHG